ncbi:MAG TPA: metal-sensitive transcriptional regulator [Acidimicrobiales bacterium]|nr:metal-sensitive transcriptional regulator [Acidimicrobiales bacterium]
MRGYSMDKDDYTRRLRRIEGQVRGLQRMVEDDTYCIDVLTQISAVSSALQSVALGLLDQHIRHCVAGAARDAEGTGDQDAARAEADRMVAEATAAIARLIR